MIRELSIIVQIPSMSDKVSDDQFNEAYHRESIVVILKDNFEYFIRLVYQEGLFLKVQQITKYSWKDQTFVR